MDRSLSEKIKTADRLSWEKAAAKPIKNVIPIELTFYYTDLCYNFSNRSCFYYFVAIGFIFLCYAMARAHQ